MFKKWLFLVAVSISMSFSFCLAQNKTTAKYPSLLWEITGNGLQKPSYLFGTMHVSSKMAFHLSDSFYYALKSVDAVALELNPDIWQGQMVSMDRLKENYGNYIQAPGGDFLMESSFSIGKYDDELKAALNTEPTVVNSLLYRSYKAKEDFEEDTFLDLYIFQTGKKLGKRATGVEDYFEAEKIVMEGYADMAKEKSKKALDLDGESGYDIQEKIQSAYKRGDLDLMDSLDIMMDRSKALREKMVYKRNIIQANSIDTIIKRNSLFVGVGAAHLPGDRGVIELLRQKGYTLRPIYMVDRDAVQKESIDKAKVPVTFSTRVADDGFYSVAMPGPLFKLTNEYQRLDRRQYADMSNGSYYIVTRLKTHGAFLGQKQEDVIKKIDSVLYENIPGKILSKKMITNSGYPGYDITNRTRRGDLQRYEIFITPFEILFFKMSGKENYVDGSEAEQFFSSIKLKQADHAPVVFEPKQGGFTVQFPQQPTEYLNTLTSDGSNRWEYEATDQASGNTYLVFKKTINNFRFLDEDTFDLSLMEESFRSPEFFDKQISRKPGTFNGYPSLDVKERLKDGSEVTAKYIIKGPHYYVLAARTNNKKADLSAFFNSFHFTPYRYAAPKAYVDTFMHFTVTTPVVPELDEGIRTLVEKATQDAANGINYNGYINYWPKVKNGLFTSDSTGETIGVSIQEYPKYYYLKDSANFWKNVLADHYDKRDLFLYSKDSFQFNNGINGYRFVLRDTGSSRTISRMIILKDNYTFSLVSMGDTLNKGSDFINSFYNTFRPEEKKLGNNIFANRLDDFFTDLFSKDSATHNKAEQSLSSLYFGEKGAPKIMDAINRLSKKDKDYFETKTKLIAELGYIRDTVRPQVVGYLKKIYEQTTDTSTFQNEVITALARHRTKPAYELLKELVLQDPPVFDNNYAYTGLFRNIEDSLELAKVLFPELLQLSSLDDYKDNVVSLLVKLVDSNIVSAATYENYFPKIYFDAKIELKKQQGKDEKKMEEENNKDADDDIKMPVRYGKYNYNNQNKNLNEYSVLLMPYYDKNPNVPKFFDKLLQSKDADVRMTAAVLMIRNNKPVADSIINFLAQKDEHRSDLFDKLERIKRLDKFPVKYKNQLDMARSLLVGENEYDKLDSVAFISKQVATYKGKKGWVYFFKYRVKKEDDWKIGISGLQPLNEKEVSSDDDLVTMTDKKLKKDEPQDEQLQKQLKRILIVSHKSGKVFFGGSNYDYFSRLKGLDSED